jgi:hypothetical protein
MTRVALTVLVAGLGAALYLLRPAAPRALTDSASSRTRGAIHVHSTRSDGGGDIASIAAAAARAGLAFVIVTDHGDATRSPDPPRYLSGVLCIDAVEISTEQGHVVVLDLPASAYPIGGEARDVLQDVERVGGFAIAAHPDSAKPDLQWRDNETPVDGIEWLNGDSEWRDETIPALTRALLMYPVFGSRALVTLLDRPGVTLARWDALTAQRRVVGVAAADAHERLSLRSPDEPTRTGSALPVPSYEQAFRMYSNVLPSIRLSGDALADARLVLDAIRAGAMYSVVDGLATPGNLSVTASSGASTVSVGGELSASGPVSFRVELDAPADASLQLIRNGDVVASRSGGMLEHTVTAEVAGAYRVEVLLPGAPGVPSVPWIVSNPVYVRTESQARPIAPPVAARLTFSPQYADGPATAWHVEHSPSSRAVFDEVAALEGRQLQFRYALGGMASESAFAAFVMPAGMDLRNHDRLVFTTRANRPMRMSVQLREAGEGGARWHRSVYLDQTSRTITVFFDDMRPKEGSATDPPLDRVDSVLFVIDTVNTPVGGNGTVWLDDVRYAR